MEPIFQIIELMWQSFLRIWPYMVITIPLAVIINLSGASRHIKRAFQAQPLVAILLATVIGAFSPFCSCGVIPIIASLLISGVPLAPVMSFWIVSPSMDPEIFFLSVATLGPELAAWRMGGIFIISLAAGLITHYLILSGRLSPSILRPNYRTEARPVGQLIRVGWQHLRTTAVRHVSLIQTQPPALCCVTPAITFQVEPAAGQSAAAGPPPSAVSCSGPVCANRQPAWHERLWEETRGAIWMVTKFMLLAFFLEALIKLYIPTAWITGLMGSDNMGAIWLAALLGVPIYTSNLAALPLVSGLLAQGMNPAAALAFLVAGPTTTLPAMAAVWGLVRRRVFALYVAIAFLGAIGLGISYSFMH
ncbi:MAG: permease [Chloroflexota bacterium]|jgi:uncharacterized protein